MRLYGTCKICKKDFYEEIDIEKDLDIDDTIENSWIPKICEKCKKEKK